MSENDPYLPWNGSTTARYYGEVIFDGFDGNTDYNYGYTDEDVDESDVDSMAPEGATILERTLVDREGQF